LKRSGALEGNHPKHLRLLETLNIFAVRANYMAQFRDYLEREGVDTELPVELPLFIWANEKFLKRGLVVPRPPAGRDFTKEVLLLLEPDPEIRVHVDMSLRVEKLGGQNGGIKTKEAKTGPPQHLPRESRLWIDWHRAYLDILTFKERKGFSNLIIRPEILPQILEKVPWAIVAEERVVNPKLFEDCGLTQEAIFRFLSRYVERFYQRKREGWDKQTLIYRPLDENDPNIGFNRELIRDKPRPAYLVRVSRSERQLVDAIQKLIAEAQRLYYQENSSLSRIHFDRHLYQPLLLEQAAKAQLVPPGLKKSEAQFVRDLREYWNREKDDSLAGKEVFLLRNLSRGQGVGFFEERGFYPDFILWVVKQKEQRIVFIEPHGMIHAEAFIHDEKARLHERLPALSKRLEGGAIAGRSVWMPSLSPQPDTMTFINDTMMGPGTELDLPRNISSFRGLCRVIITSRSSLKKEEEAESYFTLQLSKGG
ncbi:MAG: hypothetical protein N2509_08695, partial [Treponemataceae bacterium]|nr:hypothetical protein [Treponemataceae bacterium]